jgi:hypothetical protein
VFENPLKLRLKTICTCFGEEFAIVFNTITHCLWADQPTDFIMPKTQHSLKFKNLKKICNPSLVSYKQLLLQKIYHKKPPYAFFCLFLLKNPAVGSFLRPWLCSFFQ